MKKLFILILFFALMQVGFAKKVATPPELLNAEIFIADGDKYSVSNGKFYQLMENMDEEERVWTPSTF